MLPVVIAEGGAVAARAAPAVMAAATNVFRAAAKATPEIVDVVAKRTGIRGGVDAIVNAMRNNKVMTSLVMMDLGVEGARIISELSKSDADVAETVSRFGWKPDPVDEKLESNLRLQTEEVAVITRAARAMNGLENLLALRRALQLTDRHYSLYDELRVMSNALS